VQLLQAIVRHSQQTGLCFACNTLQMFATTIRERTELTNVESLDLAGEHQESILSEIIERLQLPGQNHPLTAELLHMMVPWERSN